MRDKLTPKIILEGTRLTRKTDLAFALNEHPRIVGPRRYRYHSPLVSAEWCGFTPLPWGRGLVNFAPDEEARAMETFATWARLFELLPHYSWIADRFHVSSRVWHRDHEGREIDLSWLEARLLLLGFHVVLCVRRPETFEAARRERLRVSGNPGQYADLDAFVAEQERFRSACAESALPLLELDMTSATLAEACDSVADWMTETGGLWAP